MIISVPDEAYVEFHLPSKKLVVKAIQEWLVDAYEILMLPNNYIHIVNKSTKVVQCRRVARGNTKVLIPKYLLKIQ